MMFRKQEEPLLVSHYKIWDFAEHNALTDLIRYHNRWYCAFRESDSHAFGKSGVIRLIESSNAIVWKSTAVFEEAGVDLRDPKLSITPTGHLMLLVGGTVYGADESYVVRQPRVSFSNNGTDWSPFELILEPHDWLWRVTWDKGKGYGVAYRYSNTSDSHQEWQISLYETIDGSSYNRFLDLDIKGYPNETTLRFLPTGEMIALLRRDKLEDNHAWIGISQPPSYTDWKWIPAGHYFGGPNFLILPNGDMWAGGRLMYQTPYGLVEKTALASMSLEGLNPVLILPSGGDTSYPGLVYHDGYLWMTYYSSHEEKTAIYMAKILLP